VRAIQQHSNRSHFDLHQANEVMGGLFQFCIT
jgi:hypothetical protein